MRMDLTVTDYPTYDDLMKYVYGVGRRDRAADGAGAGAGRAAGRCVEPYAARPRRRLPARRTSSATSARTCAAAGSTCPARTWRTSAWTAERLAPRRGGRPDPAAAGVRDRPDPRALPGRGAGDPAAAPDAAGTASAPRCGSTAGSSTRSSAPTTGCWTGGSPSGCHAGSRWPCPAWPAPTRPAGDRPGWCRGCRRRGVRPPSSPPSGVAPLPGRLRLCPPAEQRRAADKPSASAAEQAQSRRRGSCRG